MRNSSEVQITGPLFTTNHSLYSQLQRRYVCCRGDKYVVSFGMLGTVDCLEAVLSVTLQYNRPIEDMWRAVSVTISWLRNSSLATFWQECVRLYVVNLLHFIKLLHNTNDDITIACYWSGKFWVVSLLLTEYGVNLALMLGKLEL